MKNIIGTLLRLPKWCAIILILLYSILVAEFFSTINNMLLDDSRSEINLVKIISGISFGLLIISGIVVWIISTFLFHLTALLFNGESSFKDFIFVSAYPYIIPVIMILTGIFLLDSIQISNMENISGFLAENSSFRLVLNLINISFIPYYLIIVVLIRHLHKIKYFHAVLSVLVPVLSIWILTQLFTWLL